MGETSEDEGNNSGGDDSDWSPSHESTSSCSQTKSIDAPKKNKPGRRMQERNTTTTLTASSGRISKSKSVKDRKERKKMQNVEAARRYREENKVEEEERILLKKNSELKETLNGIELELNTIKKLMTELGLIKLVTPKTSHVKK